MALQISTFFEDPIMFVSIVLKNRGNIGLSIEMSDSKGTFLKFTNSSFLSDVWLISTIFRSWYPIFIPTVIFFLNGNTFLKEDVNRSVVVEDLEAVDASGIDGFFPRMSSKSLSVEEIISGFPKAAPHF
jgi:hypothetical protein